MFGLVFGCALVACPPLVWTIKYFRFGLSYLIIKPHILVDLTLFLFLLMPSTGSGHKGSLFTIHQ